MTRKSHAPTLRVNDVFHIDRSLAILVPEDMPFADVVKAFAKRADLRGIFVVNSDQELRGVITRQDLLHWAASKLHIEDPAGWDWREIYRIVGATTAIEACRRGSADCAVQPDDAVTDVLAIMLQNELIDVPVVDEHGKILGDIRMTEILAKVFEGS